MVRSRILAIVVALVLVAVSLAVSACGDDGQDDGAAPDVIRLSGSGTTTPLLRVLTDAYPDESVSFAYLPGLHSGGGIEGVAQGSLDMGMVSRDIESDEEQYGLELTVLSNDALVIIVHPTVMIDGLTTEQVRGIYSGAYSDWSELGGPDMPIVVLDREEDESAKIVLREYVIGDLEMTEAAVSLFYESDMLEAAGSTAGAIGFVSLGNAVSQDADVTVVALDGVEPTVENVLAGEYAPVRPLGVVTSPDASEGVRDFIAWASGSDAGDLMGENGFAPCQQ